MSGSSFSDEKYSSDRPYLAVRTKCRVAKWLGLLRHKTAPSRVYGSIRELHAIVDTIQTTVLQGAKKKLARQLQYVVVDITAWPT